MSRNWMPIEGFVDIGGSTWLKLITGEVCLATFCDCQWMRDDTDSEDVDDAFSRWNYDGNHIEMHQIFAFCPATREEERIFDALYEVWPHNSDPTSSITHNYKGKQNG